MKRGTSKSAKTKKNSNEEVKSKPLEPKYNQEQESDFNFGGIPDRNLKKNLGCG